MISNLERLRAVSIGGGVIDCAIGNDPGGRQWIAAADVTGTVLVLDEALAETWRRQFDIPAWGVALDLEHRRVAVGLADKQGGRGGLVVADLDCAEADTSIELPAPVWDVAFDARGIAYASTWGQGVAWVDPFAGERGTLDVPGRLFGLRAHDEDGDIGPLLSITVGGTGVRAVGLSGHPREWRPSSDEDWMLRSSTACYKHLFAHGRLHVGSASPRMSLADLQKWPRFGPTTDYRALGSDTCAIAVMEPGTIVYGGLDGLAQLASVARPTSPIAVNDLGAAIWSIVSAEGDRVCWAAQGDGDLVEYRLASLEAEAQSAGPTGPVPYGALHGAKIFISYASEDHGQAAELYTFLRSIGCHPWLDRENILPGQSWRSAIQKGLEDSDFVVLCLSYRSVTKRGYVQKELKTAMTMLEELPEEDIFVIPARLEECQVPSALASRQWVDLFAPGGHERMVRALYAGTIARARNEP